MSKTRAAKTQSANEEIRRLRAQLAATVEEVERLKRELEADKYGTGPLRKRLAAADAKVKELEKELAYCQTNHAYVFHEQRKAILDFHAQRDAALATLATVERGRDEARAEYHRENLAAAALQEKLDAALSGSAAPEPCSYCKGSRTDPNLSCAPCPMCWRKSDKPAPDLVPREELEKAREDAATFVEHQAYEAEKETGLLRAELAAKDAALVAAREALRHFGSHDDECINACNRIPPGGEVGPCTCGFDAAISTITAALKGSEA